MTVGQERTDDRSVHTLSTTKKVALAAGPILGIACYLLLPADLAAPARAAAGVGVLMATWWMTEAVPIPVTALLPLVLFPTLGVLETDAAAAPYANPVIFLVLGGVLLGLATQRWNLHRRIALRTVLLMGTRPSRLVFGLMVASAFISMWVSNTATAVIMVPIGLSILQLVSSLDERAATGKLGSAMLLGVAYAVTIGSMATPIGQPPMALMKAYLAATHGFDLGFGQWMLVGVPFGAVLLGVAWLVLTKLVFRSELDEIPGGRGLIRSELDKLGPLSGPERSVLLVFAAAACCWVVVPTLAELPLLASWTWLGSISDTVVAMAAAIALFLIPAGRRHNGPLLEWSATSEVPWGVLLLFGGGLSLSAAFSETGFSEWLGQQVAGVPVPPVVLLLIAVVTVILLTELTSNTATAAAFFPIMGSVAVGVGMDPLLMTIAVAMAVSCAFMLPVATPSNAVAFATGELPIKHMIRAGVLINLAGMALIMLTMVTLVPLVFGVSL
ncbi:MULTISPECIES: SLC13 family permease [Prauserella salsuginis group]|uniref:Sodium-dependent dicarboxylate transporter SdcS n=2 Tax=Prauserella salsuginis group TaxID=2893672 RepID=A0A839XEM0_9PSEU|nr:MULTISPECIES: DASS family sodium-coupled anion symporter [Prauserella salsuginis group]MBB3662402.1 sodium-dependent dicarboxylate transporter 2/3/5 [Prauserella sediminis]MCR3720112.1 solute carrier family 13 (sodium-dependent dicarboxylate transporter), member 2/3/5 [Prauserella flava]MCR3736342.1 solute carrier family 13 (sodium-dependent dicarboxylate transporter), member 2/3/5 [Prauserella salsuginis]